MSSRALIIEDTTADIELLKVSHELRTPLASLVGFAELLLERELSATARKQYLETMLKEGNRLTDLINDFLHLQGLEGGYKRLDLGPADLRTVIVRAVDAAGTESADTTPSRSAFGLALGDR